MDKQRWVRRLLADLRGATAVEYGLIAALIVIAAMASLGTMASTTTNMWNSVSNNLSESSAR